MALDFDGATDYVIWGSAASLDDVAVKTMMAWINFDTFGEASFGRILDKAGAVSTSGWVFFVKNAGAGNLSCISFSSTRSIAGGQWTSPASSVGVGAWFHVVAIYDNGSTANDAAFFINGASSASSELTAPVGTNTSDAANDLWMGDRVGTDRAFDGRMEDVRIYNRALSAAEIETIYASRGRDAIVTGLIFRAPLRDKGDGVAAAAGDPKDVTEFLHPSTQAGTPPYQSGTQNPGGIGGVSS